MIAFRLDHHLAGQPVEEGHRDVAHQGGGHGLVGLRERAELLGGVFRAGRTPDGGFTVEALLRGDADPASGAGVRPAASAEGPPGVR